MLVISNKFSRNWQLPVKVTDYIKENFEKVEEIDIFEVYEK